MIVACPACDSSDGWNLHWRQRQSFFGVDESQLVIVCPACGYEESTTRATESLSRTGALVKRRH